MLCRFTYVCDRERRISIFLLMSPMVYYIYRRECFKFFIFFIFYVKQKQIFRLSTFAITRHTRRIKHWRVYANANAIYPFTTLQVLGQVVRLEKWCGRIIAKYLSIYRRKRICDSAICCRYYQAVSRTNGNFKIDEILSTTICVRVCWDLFSVKAFQERGRADRKRLCVVNRSRLVNGSPR